MIRTFMFACTARMNWAASTQRSPPPGDGCDATLEWWFTDEALDPPPLDPADRPPELVLADLPAACRTVLAAE